VRRLASEDYMLQQGGFEDMESASEAGLPEAQLWVGQRMAFGKDGYKLQPSSGLKLMEKAAAAGNLEAILAVAGMYAQDAYMADKAKAREWYRRAADKGSDEAKGWLDTLDADSDS
jgi:TPR repeat protein